MVIEFYGMPGSGKTTFANGIVKKNSGNALWINMIDKSRTSFLYKIYFRIMRLMANNNRCYINSKNIILEIVKGYRNIPAKYNNVFIDSYAAEIAFDMWLYRRMYEKKKVYIFDEGIIQQVINMCVNYDIDIKIIENLLKCVNSGKELRFYYATSVECAYKSIKLRNRHVCFIDELTGKELKDFLDKYNESCQLLFKMINSEKIDRNDSFENKTGIIQKAIRLEK